MKKLLGFKSGSRSCQQRMGWKAAWLCTARPAKAGGMAVLEHRPAFPGCCLSSVSSNPRELANFCAKPFLCWNVPKKRWW